ncbi:NAD(+) diphosphatase [Ahrensia kielensis]|uniref:NAD(+) diphosphatase n=1 Tax=Ahrensia kielensis TaxID=76980 RepID=A0ABU9T9T6_9HYPH
MTFSLFDAPYPEYSAGCAFTGNPLNRFSERRTQNCVAEALATRGAKLLVVAYGKVLFKKEENNLNAIFTPQELKTAQVDESKIVLLGWDGKGLPWLIAPSDFTEENLSDDFEAIDFRSVYIQGLLEEAQLGMLAQGGALLSWHKSHAFCSRCGTASNMRDGGYKRVCPNCGAEHFPRTDPVVIMLTVSQDNEKCLLGRSPHFAQGVYSCLAGFVEPGETIEMAMRRETKEETNIDVERVSYHASQPWPFPYTMMIGCYGVAASESIIVDDELEDARWFSRDEVRQIANGTHPDGFIMPPKGAIASNLVLHWLNSA